MPALTRAQFLKRLVSARRKIDQRIAEQSQGVYGRGLAGEGYDGGYRAALDDVEALLRHGMPNDARGFWKC